MTELEKLVEKDAIRDQYYVYARALDRIDKRKDDCLGENTVFKQSGAELLRGCFAA